MLAQYQEAISRYRQRIFSFAYYSLRVREDAEDLTQDVFIRLWQHWPSIDQQRVGGWLMRVAHNAVVDHVRKRRTRGQEVDPDDCPELAGPNDEPGMESGSFRRVLEQAVSQLADPYRSILIMRDIQGLAYNEIEHALGLTQSQVKVYLHRARRQLRDNHSLRQLARDAAIIDGDEQNLNRFPVGRA